MSKNYPKMIYYLVCTLFFAFHSRPLLAKDLGRQGYTFPIQEEALFPNATTERPLPPITKQKIESRLNSFTPPRLATTKRIYYQDPTFTAPDEIRDHQGKIVISKGAQVNPLEHKKLTSKLLFIDGTDTSQVEWAKNQTGQTKWVLVKGSPFQLEDQLQRPVYFDQEGRYMRYFGIQNVPARVSQEGNRLKIEEIPVIEN